MRMFWLAMTGGLKREIARCDAARSDPEFHRPEHRAVLAARRVR
jgi:hypothetical protein